MNTLQEQRRKLSQEQARLQRNEALLKIRERKTRISNFIRMGEMMERCKISTLNHNVLAGGFLFIRESLKNPQLISEWAAKGTPYVQKISQPKKELDTLHIIFQVHPPAEIRRILWEKGFTCENNEYVWEGKGLKKEVEGIVSTHGSVYKMKGPQVLKVG